MQRKKKLPLKSDHIWLQKILLPDEYSIVSFFVIGLIFIADVNRNLIDCFKKLDWQTI